MITTQVYYGVWRSEGEAGEWEVDPLDTDALLATDRGNAEEYATILRARQRTRHTFRGKEFYVEDVTAQTITFRACPFMEVEQRSGSDMQRGVSPLMTLHLRGRPLC